MTCRRSAKSSQNCLPGVGENLIDHPESIIIWELNRPLPPEGVMMSTARCS